MSVQQPSSNSNGQVSNGNKRPVNGADKNEVKKTKAQEEEKKETTEEIMDEEDMAVEAYNRLVRLLKYYDFSVSTVEAVLTWCSEWPGKRFILTLNVTLTDDRKGDIIIDPETGWCVGGVFKEADLFETAGFVAEGWLSRVTQELVCSPFSVFLRTLT